MHSDPEHNNDKHFGSQRSRETNLKGMACFHELLPFHMTLIMSSTLNDNVIQI